MSSVKFEAKKIGIARKEGLSVQIDDANVTIYPSAIRYIQREFAKARRSYPSMNLDDSSFCEAVLVGASVSSAVKRKAPGIGVTDMKQTWINMRVCPGTSAPHHCAKPSILDRKSEILSSDKITDKVVSAYIDHKNLKS
jgi:hypothetical protein